MAHIQVPTRAIFGNRKRHEKALAARRCLKQLRCVRYRTNIKQPPVFNARLKAIASFVLFLIAFLHPEDTMNDADLVIIESWQDVPLKGGCSACPEVIFDAGVLIGNKRQQELTLTAMFTVHYDQVHQPPRWTANERAAPSNPNI